MTNPKSHQPGEQSVDDIVGDEAEARRNLSLAPDTLADMTKSKSHPWAEPSLDGIVGDGAVARANLSQAPDTLAGMTNPKSHQLGEATRREPGGCQVLPEGLEQMAPGAALAAVLETVDLSRLNGHDLVTVLRAEQRQMSHRQARLYAVMAETAHAVSAATTGRSPRPNEHAADEIAAALAYTRRKAEDELNTALRLRDHLPEVASALKSGGIDGHKASVISDAVSGLEEGSARGVAGKILASASGLTVGQIGARARRLCILEDPDRAQTRYVQSLERRRLVARPTADGTTHLHISDCAPHLAQAATDRVNRIARSLNTSHEPRSIDQLRADVALDLLTGRLTREDGGGRAGSINLHVDLTTLAGLDDHPGDLAGFGPVTADIARKVAAESAEVEWRYTVTVNGEPAHVGTTSRRPTASMRRLVEARHRTCVFPGCRMPSVDCDLDHRVAVSDGGPTQPCNLTPLCRKHHRAKHEAGWDYQVEDNHVEWTSPIGHTYRTGARPAGLTRGRDPP